MTREMAVFLLRNNDVYLTPAGKKWLQKIAAKDNKKKCGVHKV